MDKTIAEIVLRFQHPSAWQVAFEQAADRRREQAGAELSHKYANEQSDDPDRQISDAERANWRRYAQTHDNHAEQYRQAVLAWSAELLQVRNFCRLNAPHVLPMIPNVDPFRDSTADYQSLADKMIEVEAALLALEPIEKLPSGNGKQDSGLKLPTDQNLLDLWNKLVAEQGNGKADTQIADDFSKTNGRKYLSRLKRARTGGKVSDWRK